MISTELAKYLLTHYKEALVGLGKKIDADKARRNDGQSEIIPYIIGALMQISGEQQVVPKISVGMPGFCGNDPQTGLLTLITKQYLDREYKLYLEDDALDTLNDFSNYIFQKPLVFFKDYNGDLRINFPSRAWCEAFKKELDIEQFPVDARPLVEGSNTKLCFKGTRDKDHGGQLRIPFPTPELREKFLMLLRHMPATTLELPQSAPREIPVPVMTLVENDPLAVYFTSDFYIYKFELKVLAPAEISLDENSVRKDMLYATRMIAQGIRSDESRFRFFLKDPVKHIISHATGGNDLHTEGMQTLQVDDSQFLNVIANRL